MHLLIIPSWYPENANDIRGVFFREQAIAIADSEVKTGVIAPIQYSLRQFKKIVTNYSRGIKKEIDNGVITFRLHGWAYFPKVPYVNQKLWLNMGWKLFDHYIKENGMPDVIHAHSVLMGGVLARQIKQRHNIPVVLTEHSSGFARGLMRSWQVKLTARAFESVDRQVVVSPSLGQLLESQFKGHIKPCEWIPNVVEKSFFMEKLPLKKSGKDIFVFLNIALMTENKGQADLIRAFANIVNQGMSNVDLKIGGDGQLESDLKLLVSELGVADKVSFLGRLNREQVVSEVKSADVFVLSSHYETFGVVVAEALALGAPVIATKCGGPECMINEHNGLLVSVNDPVKLTGAMQTLYAKARVSYDRLAIRKGCQEQFGEEAITSELKELYLSLMQDTVA